MDNQSCLSKWDKIEYKLRHNMQHQDLTFRADQSENIPVVVEEEAKQEELCSRRSSDDDYKLR